MISFIPKIINVPSGETSPLVAAELWEVRWESLYRFVGNSYHTHEQLEAFPLKEDAEKFAASLKDAMKLLGNTGVEVRIQRRKA